MDDNPEFYWFAFGPKGDIPSEETLRQSLDEIGGFTLECGYVPVDVPPLDDSKSGKEGVSRTYKGFDGYAPIMVYVGTRGTS